jgi:hypothetical protein
MRATNPALDLGELVGQSEIFVPHRHTCLEIAEEPLRTVPVDGLPDVTGAVAHAFRKTAHGAPLRGADRTRSIRAIRSSRTQRRIP